MPRLTEFRALYPEINIVLNPTAETVQLTPGGVDLSIRFGAGDWPGVESVLLVPTDIVVVASPGLIAGRDTSTPEALSAFAWLDEVGTSESTEWFRARGVAQGARGGFIQVPGNLLLDGARDGQGLAVTVRRFVEADIRAGRLVVLRHQDSPGMGYYLVTRSGIQRPPLHAFVKWIKKAARDLT